MPQATDEELRGYTIDMSDCKKFANMPDAELDRATVEAWRKSPAWAVISKAIRATLHQQHLALRDVRTPAESRTFVSGYITGLEYVHNIIWEAMERDIPSEQRAGGGPNSAENASQLDETMRDIQKLEEDFK